MAAALTLTKHDDGSATVATGKGRFKFSDVEFDDLVHAVPLNTTALYRLLIDTLLTEDNRRQELRKIIEADGNPDATLTALQDEVLKFVEE
ncbi:MAG: hypothetical protein IT462_08035 [Planctomycetes bacterium]|nr:hypothetical protein [Planctomycetota bacterium]